jgi:aspartate/methionine/tyrosine aminotransferase
VRGIKPSPTLGMAAEAAALRAEGRDIVDLSAGSSRRANDLGAYLLRHASVATVPGEGFGAPRHIRLSYAAPRQVLEEGITRIGNALAQLR